MSKVRQHDYLDNEELGVLVKACVMRTPQDRTGTAEISLAVSIEFFLKDFPARRPFIERADGLGQAIARQTAGQKRRTRCANTLPL